GMLLPCPLEINPLAIEVRQFAVIDRGTDRPGDRDHRSAHPAILRTGDVNCHIDHQFAKSPNDQIQRTRMRSDRVKMKVLSVLKSRTSTAGLCGVIIVDSRSTGVEISTNGN